MPCSVCTHPERGAIDKALAAGQPNRRIATQHGLTEAAIRRHRAAHLPQTLVKAQEAADEVAGLNALEELRLVNQVAHHWLAAGMGRGPGWEHGENPDLCFKAMDRIHQQINLMLKVEELGVRRQELTLRQDELEAIKLRVGELLDSMELDPGYPILVRGQRAEVEVA